MALPAPPFQDFMKRTPPVPDSDRALPPRPFLTRRASDSSNSRSRSRTTSPFTGRRSSSVYSRTVSQWNSDRISWTSADFADEPVPPLPLLRPLAYSASTPQLVERKTEPLAPVLQPRMFSPLIRTPSATTASKANTPVLAQEEGNSYFSARKTPSEPQKKHARTISLEEARAAVQAPGAIHFLPEELRARQVRKSRSDEALRNAPLFAVANVMANVSREPPTLVDRQGRRRTLISPRDSFAYVAKHPFALSKGVNMATDVASHFGNAKEAPAVPSAGHEDFDEPRGRTRQRGPRRLNHEHYLRNGQQGAERSTSYEEPRSQVIVTEYHAIVAEQRRRDLSDARDFANVDSENRIRAYMDMIPQPLFHSKPLARSPGQLGQSNDDQIITPYALSPAMSESGDSVNSERRKRQESIPHSLTIPATAAHRRSSTSGTIPISPPEPLVRSFTVHTSRSGVSGVSQPASSKKHKADSRVSACYPHVASRKKTKARKGSKDLHKDSDIPPMPFLFSGADAHSIESGSYGSSPTSFNTMPFAKFGSHSKQRKESDASSKRSRPRLHERVVKGAVDLMTHHNESEPGAHKSATTATASEGSPHLLPSPVSARKEVHLGWSDIAKTTFDKVISPTKTPPKSESPVITHSTTPARPLDEMRAGLRETESPRRKNSIFGTFLDSWKEGKAERRREELKKMIRFVPYETEESPVDTGRRSSVLGWM